MALPLYNPAEGTTGASITTAAGASTSGDAMDVISGTGITFNSLAAAHGATGWRFTSAATVVAAYLGWSTSLGTLATNQTLNVRFYFTARAVAGSTTRLCQILNGSTALLGIGYASGTNDFHVRAGDTDIAASHLGAAPTVGTGYRIEVALTGIGGGATAGGYTITAYVGDTLTQLGTQKTGTGQNFGTLAPNAVRFGVTTAAGAASTAFDFDDPAVSATGMPAIPGAAASRGPLRRSPQRQVGQFGRGVFPMFGWRAGRRGLCVAEKRLWTPERARAS